jgi:hypothetical protein
VERLPPVSALNELDEAVHEPRRRRAVHNVVVEGDSQTKQVARFHPLLNDSGLAGDAADDEEQRLPGRCQAPAPATTRHADPRSRPPCRPP